MEGKPLDNCRALYVCITCLTPGCDVVFVSELARMLAGTVYSRWRLITRVDEWTTLRNYIEFSIITRVECVGFELSMTCIAIGNFRAACIMSNAKKKRERFMGK